MKILGGGRPQHHYTEEDLDKLRAIFDTQLLTAAALIYSTQEPAHDENERQEILSVIAADVVDIRDELLIELNHRSG